ncbi:YmL10 [Malassezia sp. CBS 17886]|nr:YmL10 [Malassezia sp. CBS 17886]
MFSAAVASRMGAATGGAGGVVAVMRASARGVRVPPAWRSPASVERHAREFVPLNVDRLQFWIDQGRINAKEPITMKELYDSRCIHRLGDGVKLLGDGESHLRTSVSIVVSRASRSAIKAVEAAGGSIMCRYYNATSLRATVKPQKWLQQDKPLPRFADPVSRRDLLWYSSLNNRGYLALRDRQERAAAAQDAAQ